MQAVLWHADDLKLKSTLEEHTLLITDVRFSPSMPRLATSSFDKTVRVWDVDNVSFKCFTSHAIMQHFLLKTSVLSFGHHYGLLGIFLDVCTRTFISALYAVALSLLDKYFILSVIFQDLQ